MTPFWQARKPLIEKMIAQGATAEVLAKHFNCSQSNMNRILRLMDLKACRGRKQATGFVMDAKVPPEAPGVRDYMARMKVAFEDVGVAR